MLVVSSSQHVELRALATHHLTAMQQYVPAESQQQAWAVLDAVCISAVVFVLLLAMHGFALLCLLIISIHTTLQL